MDLLGSDTPEKETVDNLLNTLIDTGYFNIPRSFEEVRQDLQAENEINDTDLKNLLDSMNIELIPEEPQQNLPKKEQTEHDDL